MKEAKEHICVTHRHRQQCDDGQRRGEQGLGGGGQSGGNGDSCNSGSNKNKENIKIIFNYQINVRMIKKISRRYDYLNC